MKCKLLKFHRLIYLFLLINNALAQSFTAVTSNTTTVCAGGQVNIRYRADANFSAGNEIFVELSNASGSFASPVVLNTATTTAASGNYNVTIPLATAGGNFYRIRVRSTNPANTLNVGTVFTIVTQAQCICPDDMKIDWQISLGGNADDFFRAMVPTADGGYLLGGSSLSGQNTGNKTSPQFNVSQDYWVVKVNAAGVIQWDSTYGGNFTDQLWTIIPTPDGGFLLGGQSNSDPSTGNKTAASYGNEDIWLVKINANGVKQWDQSFGGTGIELLFDIVPTADGGYLLGGQSTSGANGNKTSAGNGVGDFWIVKIDANGNLLWDLSYGGSTTDQLRKIIALPNGDYLLAGYSNSPASGTKTIANNNATFFDYYVVRIDANGNQIWDNIYGGTNNDQLRSAIPSADGHFILVGPSNSPTSAQKTATQKGGNDIWAVKIDANGVQLWDSTYGGTGSEVDPSIIAAKDGGFFIGSLSASGANGNKSTPSFGGNDYWVFKINSNGIKTNEYVYGSSAAENMLAKQSIWPTSDGGFLVGGFSSGTVTGNKSLVSNGLSDYWVVKVSPTVNITATARTTTVCAGESLAIDYSTACGTLQSGNEIRIELSDASGSFASPVVLNTAATTAGSGSVNVTIPPATPGGNYYRIRVVSTNPESTSLIGNVFTIVSQQQCYCPADMKIDWQMVAGGTSSDQLQAIVPTPDGGFLLAGISQSANNGNKTAPSFANLSFDSWVIKINAAGTIQWDFVYGGTLSEGATTIIPTADGGFLLGTSTESAAGTGNKTSPSYGRDDFWVAKVDGNGVKQWDQTYGGNLDDDLSAMIATSDGGYMLAGTTISNAGGNQTNYRLGDGNSYWIVKIDAFGNKLWDQVYGGNWADTLRDIIQLPDGGFLLGGMSTSPANGKKTKPANQFTVSDYYVVKIDANGNQIWDEVYGGLAPENFRKIVPTTDGGYLLTGQSRSAPSAQKTSPFFGVVDAWVVKIDANGVQQWDSSYGGSLNESHNSTVSARDGGFYLAIGSNSLADGNKMIPTKGNIDMWAVKINAQGIKTKEYGYGGTGVDGLTAILPTSDGGFLLGGQSSSGISGDKTLGNFGFGDYWVVKVSPNIQLSATARTNTVCAGEALTIDYASSCGAFQSGNEIRIELSNAAGSFASPTVLNTTNTTAASGSYNVTIPPATPGGEFYRIRVISSNPVDTVIIGKLFTIVPPAFCNCGNDLFSEWQRSFGGTAAEDPSVILPTPDGGYLFGGNSLSEPGGNKTSPLYGTGHFWLVKTDALGNIQWDSSYGGDGSETFRVIIPAQDGGYILGGRTNTNFASGNLTPITFGNNDYWIVKIDINGVIQWQQRFGGNQNDDLYAIVPTPDGGYLLGGESASGVTGSRTAPSFTGIDYWVVKIDGNGNQLWDKAYGGSGNDFLRAMLPTADGGYLLAGHSTSDANGLKSENRNSGNPGQADYWVVKTDANGDFQWDKTIGGTAADQVRSAISLVDGNYLLVGTSSSPTPSATGQKTAPYYSGSDIWAVKIDPSGNILWDNTYGGSNVDDPGGTVQLANGTIVINSFTNSPISGNKTISNFGSPNDAWLVYIDEAGNKIKEQIWGGTTGDNGRNLFPTADGGMLMINQSISGIGGNKTINNNGQNDYWLVKLNPAPEITPIDISASSFCTGDSIGIEFDITNCGSFSSGNVFTYQLSDTLGSFTTPTVLGAAPNTTTRDTTLALPFNLPTGSGYRIRIVASSPAVISDTSAAFTINRTPDLSAGISVSCNNGLVISVPDQGTGATYQWQDNLVNIPSATNREFSPVAQGVYRVISSRGTCRDTTGTYGLTYATANGGKFVSLPDGADRLICDSITQHVMMRLDDDVDSKPHTNTSTNIYVVPSAPTYNGQPYVRRYWDVTPPTPKDKPATMTFYVTQADFNDFNANAAGWPPLPTGPADLTGISNLVVSVFHGNSATNLPATYNGRAEYKLSGVSVTVNWNAAINLWEISLPVDSFSGFFVHTVPAVLPVTLVKFTGSFDETVPEVVLHWETASERDCNYFMVEKLMDNGLFKEMGSVPCFGNSNIPREYFFTDLNFNNGSNIYRLKQVDYNGQFEYSKSIDVPAFLPNTFHFKAWTDQVFVYTEVSEEGVIDVLDMQGRVVKRFPAEAGRRLQLFVANWPSGIYMIHFSYEDKQQTQKLILQR